MVEEFVVERHQLHLAPAHLFERRLRRRCLEVVVLPFLCPDLMSSSAADSDDEHNGGEQQGAGACNSVTLSLLCLYFLVRS